MKKIILYTAIFLVFFTATIVIQNQRKKMSNDTMTETIFSKSSKKTNIKVKNYIIDAGKVSLHGDTLIQDFVIYNLGPNDLFVYNVKPDCRCTGFSNIKENKAVPVNDSSIVTLKFAPKGIGTFQVSATVETNSDIQPLLVLRGEVTP